MSIRPSVKPAMVSLMSHRTLYRGSQPTMGTLSIMYRPVAEGSALAALVVRRPTLFQVTSVRTSFFTASTTFMMTAACGLGGKGCVRPREDEMRKGARLR